METFKKMVSELEIQDNFGAKKEVLTAMFNSANVIERTEEQEMMHQC